MESLDHSFASDNAAGLCPEAAAALAAANVDHVPSYGDDALTARAKAQFSALFERECDVFFVFNGTAANALALAACGGAPHTRVICHAQAHIETDECGAPEFFSGGAKLSSVDGPDAKLTPAAVEAALHLGHGVHFPRPAALSLTQATEHGTLYSPDELRALTALARRAGLAVHMDGARFANAAATLCARGFSMADITWKAGVDVLCFGGTKNGLLATEAVVFFNRELARDFDYRVKQGGQLASKMRFAAAQWSAILEHDVWLKHAAQANAMATQLADALRAFPSLEILCPIEANAVFVRLPGQLYTTLSQRWCFHRFIGSDGYRLMCSWATQPGSIARFVADVRTALAKQ